MSAEHKDPLPDSQFIEITDFDPFDVLSDQQNDELNALLGELATNRVARHMHRDGRKQLP